MLFKGERSSREVRLRRREVALRAVKGRQCRREGHLTAREDGSLS